MLDGVLSLSWGYQTCSLIIVFGRFGWPLKGPGLVQLVKANSLIWADSDSAGWTGWEVLTVLDEWQMALVTVLVEVERVKMAVVCLSADTVEHLEYPQRDWIILKCYADSPPVVKVQLKGVVNHLSGRPRLLVIHNYIRSSRLCRR